MNGLLYSILLAAATIDAVALPLPIRADQTLPARALITDLESCEPISNIDYLHGINIGNWLVLERYMDNETVFIEEFASAKDQWSFDSIDGSAAALERHWSTYFTQVDVQRLRSYGFNALRIPIGYWAFDNAETPYKRGALVYLDKAIQWARAAGMKVLVDCHGSPGSQNGDANSGHIGSVTWQSGENLNRSTNIVLALVERYGHWNYSDVVFGVEIVNEPTTDPQNSFGKTQSWVASTYNAMQVLIVSKKLNAHLQVITHDSWMGPTQFISLAASMNAPAPGALPAGSRHNTTFGVDRHNYQLFTAGDRQLDQPAHIQKACGWRDALAVTRAAGLPVLVGEWSALTDICVRSDSTSVAGEACQPQDGSDCQCTTDDTARWNSRVVAAVRQYTEAQLDAFAASADGDFLWSFGGAGGWGVDNLVRAGAFPNLISVRRYGKQC